MLRELIIIFLLPRTLLPPRRMRVGDTHVFKISSAPPDDWVYDSFHTTLQLYMLISLFREYPENYLHNMVILWSHLINSLDYNG